MGFTYSENAMLYDVNTTDWYYEEVQKALGANYIPNDSYTNANENITREEVARILGTVFNIKKDITGADRFTDKNLFTDGNIDIIGGLNKRGYITGYTDGSFRPQDSITRAEVVKLISNISGVIINEPSTISQDITTNIVVNRSGATLKDMNIDGDVYLTEGVGNGSINLDNVVINGELFINGGGQNSIIITNSKINSISINKQRETVRVVLGNTKVDEILTENYSRIEIIDGTEINTAKLNGKVTILVDKGSTIVNLNVNDGDVKIDSAGDIKFASTKIDITINNKKLVANTEFSVEDKIVSVHKKSEPVQKR